MLVRLIVDLKERKKGSYLNLLERLAKNLVDNEIAEYVISDSKSSKSIDFPNKDKMIHKAKRK